MAEKLVFIAVGGSGTAVARAMVNLLSTGMPLAKDNGKLQGSRTQGDELQLWCVDPDSTCPAKDTLGSAVKQYQEIQEALKDQGSIGGGTGLWALSIKSETRDAVLDPAKLLAKKSHKTDCKIGSIFQTERPENSFILSLCYDKKEQDLDVGRGLYQKPFLGSSVFAAAQKELEAKINTVGSTDSARFIICGSLFGGSGASGIVVIANTIRKMITEQGIKCWKLAACVLGPYFLPPPPKPLLPAKKVQQYKDLVAAGISTESYEATSCFEEICQESKTTTGYREEVIRQILHGHYADQDTFRERTALGVHHFSGQPTNEKVFDALYYCDTADQIQYNESLGVEFSNGGIDQKNPPHAFEFVAACAALDFFSRKADSLVSTENWTFVGSGQSGSPVLKVDDLPYFGGQNKEDSIDPARWLVAVKAASGFLRELLNERGIGSANDIQNTDGVPEYWNTVFSEGDGANAFDSKFLPFMRKMFFHSSDKSPRGCLNDAYAEIFTPEAITDKLLRVQGWLKADELEGGDWPSVKKEIKKKIGNISLSLGRDALAREFSAEDVGNFVGDNPKDHVAKPGVFLAMLLGYLYQKTNREGTGTQSEERLKRVAANRTTTQLADLGFIGNENRKCDKSPYFWECTYTGAATPLNRYMVNLKKSELALQSFATPWSSTKIFELKLNAESSIEASDAPHLSEAIDEWGALIYLIYQGDLKLQLVTPRHDSLIGMGLLGKGVSDIPQVPQPDRALSIRCYLWEDNRDGICVAGYSPETLFFPARNRGGWSQLKGKLPGLEQVTREERTYLRLSFEKILADMDDAYSRKFYGHLSEIRKSISDATSGVPKDPKALQKCLDKLLHFIAREKKLDPNTMQNAVGKFAPDNKFSIEALEKANPAEDLQKGGTGNSDFWSNYPLRCDGPGGATILFTPEGLDEKLNSWLKESVGGVPLNKISRISDVKMKVMDKEHTAPEKHKIVSLRSLLLDSYWCTNEEPASAEVIAPNARQTGGLVLPVRSDFVKLLANQASGCIWSFGQIVQDSISGRSFRIVGLKVSPEVTYTAQWRTEAIGVDIQTNRAEVWPPQWAEDWHSYYVRFTLKSQMGSWMALDAKGDSPRQEEERLGSEQDYVQFVRSAPSGILLKDKPRGKEVGFIPLKIPKADSAKNTYALAMDLGTSNTCVAFAKVGNQQTAKLLPFQLSPQILWKQKRKDSHPEEDDMGWIPHSWRENKFERFFATAICIRKEKSSENEQKALRAKREIALPYLDIPALATGSYANINSGLYDAFFNLKWDPEKQSARALFLWQVLLLAHAELRFSHLGLPTKRYVFTFPLAMCAGNHKELLSTFEQDCEAEVGYIHEHILGNKMTREEVKKAVRLQTENDALALMLEKQKTGEMRLVLDMGGGTLDILVEDPKDPNSLKRDSVHLAGNDYFRILAEANEQANGRFAKIFEGSLEQLNKVLGQKITPEVHRSEGHKVMANQYNFLASGISEDERKLRLLGVADKANPSTQYTAFFAKALFTHLISYGLIMAAASIVRVERNKLAASSGETPTTERIGVWLGGNGWGLLPFAKLQLNGSKETDLSSIIKEAWPGIRRALTEDMNKCTVEGCDHKRDLECLERIEIVTHFKKDDMMLLSKSALARGAAKAGAMETMFEHLREDIDGASAELETFFGVGLGELVLTPPPESKQSSFSPKETHWFDSFKSMAFECPTLEKLFEYERAEFPQVYTKSKTEHRPFHPIQEALATMLATTKGPPLLPGDLAYRTWNELLDAYYRRDDVCSLPLYEKQLQTPPLRALLEHFFGLDHPVAKSIAKQAGVAE